MLDFRVIDISDKIWIDNLLGLSDFQGCEYSFANNLAWRRLSNSVIARFKDFYISCALNDGAPTFTFPAGAGDFREVFAEMKEFADSKGAPFVITGVTEKTLCAIGSVFGSDGFTVTESRDYSDYIYAAEDLAELKGKKYHGKRNHLKKLYAMNWKYEDISDENIDDAILFCTENYNEKCGWENYSSVAEQFALHIFFTDFQTLGLRGGLIRVDGKVQAVTIGEKINSDTLCTHIEKANAEIDGSFAAINCEFAKRNAADVKYINREEDLGIEGLRKAKLSYYPEYILKKYSVTVK